MAGEKHEYFETTEIQTKIRAGFKGILSGEIETPFPFSKSKIVGPVLNESGLDELEKELSEVLSSFFNKKPEPLNVSEDQVDRYLLKRLSAGVQTQQRLPGAPQPTYFFNGRLARRIVSLEMDGNSGKRVG